MAGSVSKLKNSRNADKRAVRESIDEDAVPYLLRQVAERLSRSLSESLKPFGRSAIVYRVLIALERLGRSTIGELAEATLIDPSTLSRTVDRMEEEGLVSHGPHAEDARATVVESTESGRRFLYDIMPVASAQYEWSIRGVSPKQLSVLQETLKQMLANLKVSPIK